MKKLYSTLLIVFCIFLYNDKVYAQNVHLKAFRMSLGTTQQNIPGIYNWHDWLLCECDIQIDLKSNRIQCENLSYDIIERPTHWIIKQYFKYAVFMCTDENLNKICIKLYHYDSGEMRVYINKEDGAVRYLTKYIKNAQ